MSKKSKNPEVRNLVAKHARTFNKAAVHRDKKKDYKRRDKWQGKKGPNRDPFYLDKYLYATTYILQKRSHRGCLVAG